MNSLRLTDLLLVNLVYKKTILTKINSCSLKLAKPGIKKNCIQNKCVIQNSE